MTFETEEMLVYLNNYKLIIITECCETCNNRVDEPGVTEYDCPKQNGKVKLNGVCDEWEEII